MHFDKMAKEFDTAERVERSKTIAAQIRSKIIDGRQKTAVEYGCGTGLVGLELADDFKSLLLVDSSRGMIEQLEKKLYDLNNPNVSALFCDFMDGVPADLRADYVFTSLVLHHIPDTEAILSRFYGILNEGGSLLIIDLDKDGGGFHADNPNFDGHNGFDQDILADMARKAGFSRAKTDTFYYGTETVHGRKAPHSLFIMVAERQAAEKQ